MKLLRFFSSGRLFVGAVLLMAALLLGTAPDARATQTVTVLDSGVYTTSPGPALNPASTPRNFMGGGYNLGTAAGTSNIALNGGTFYLVFGGTATTYTKVTATLYFWGTVNTGTVSATAPAFSNLLRTITFDLGPQTAPATASLTPFDFPLTTPVVVPTRTLGVTVAFKGDSGAGLVSTDNLTSIVRSGTPLPVGSSIFNGYFRNAAGETNGNFTTGARSLGLTNQTIALDLTATVPGPNVASSAATNVSVTGATLNGTVDPLGLATTAKFQYGTTTAYGSEAPVTLSPPDGTGVQTVSAPVTGLTANTLYNFRIVATNSSGTNVGANQTFTTAPASVSIGSVSLAEGNSGTTNFVFPVTLSAVSGSAVTVSYATSDGTATSGTDYGAAFDSDGATLGTLSIAAGATSGTITVPVNGDTVFEGNETFTVTLSIPTGATLGTLVVGTGTIQNDDAPPASTMLISEFRLGGPGGPTDEFIELMNTTNAAIDLTGITLTSSDGALTTPSLAGKSIPSGGHFLIVNSGGYSLGGVATGDASYTGDIAPNATLTLTNAGGTVLDIVGNSGVSPSSSTSQSSFARRLELGTPSNTGISTTDFNLVDTGATFSTTDSTGFGPMTAPRLGAPGPQNLASPIQRNRKVTLAAINAATVGTPAEGRYASKGSSLDPFGRQTIRRTLTNNTGGLVTQMRFRIVAATSGTATASGVADLRALTSAGVTVGGTKVVQGITLDAPSTPTVAPTGFGNNTASAGNGGGLNSSWTVNLATGSPLLLTDGSTAAGGIPDGKSINVEFLFGIVQNGSYRIVVDTELLP